MRKYFGTDGIRDIANINLTPELAYKVAKAGACILAKTSGRMPTILVGKDTRLSGDLLENAMVAGFLSVGAKVKLLGVTPTPVVSYLVVKEKADAAVVISASHNSYEYNGIKFFSNKGMKLSDEIETEIEKLLENEEELYKLNVGYDKLGTVVWATELNNKYEEYIINVFKDIPSLIEKAKNNSKDFKFKVAIDTANGATYQMAENIFKKLNIDFEIINNNPNGININDKCGSTHLEMLQKYVVDNKFNLGIAYDGDGDRLLAVDEEGNILDGDCVLAIISQYLKEKNELNNDTVVATVMSNIGLNEFTSNNKITLEQTKVGDRYVLEKMLEGNFDLGGEQSGHIILKKYNNTGDGILTSLMVIKILLEKNMRSSDILKIFQKYPQILVNVTIDNDKKKYYNDNKAIANAINELNELFKGKGRVLVRPSGTEPLIRVMIEGKDINYITEKANALAKLIEKNLK